MATSLQSFIDRENISNPVIKNNASKGLQPHRGFGATSSKTFSESKYPQATPRKALGDLGNLQYGTAKKVQSSVKPSKVKIFEDGAKTNPRKSKVKTKKILQDRNEKIYPEIEKMVPFCDQENDLSVTPHCITKMLQNPMILRPSLLLPPRNYTTDSKKETVSSLAYELESDKKPDFDDQMATIIGYNEKPELIAEDNDYLPCLDDITFDFPLFS